MKSVHTTRSEQKKGLDLMGRFLARRSLIWADYCVFKNAEAVVAY